MSTYIVLLRGINVGGNNLLPMKALQSCLRGAGYTNVQTYIQSGNIVLDADTHPRDELGSLIEKSFGIEPAIMVMAKEEFSAAQNANPFTGAGNTIHFYFCDAEPALDQPKLDSLLASSESYALHGKVFYLHAPDGIGRSKLVANIESCLGVPATGRNSNTVGKIASMLGAD